jgi:hypothetical protein
MELEHYLKQLKKITPRADYVLRSRAEIVTSLRPAYRLGWRQVVFGMVQSGSAMALMGVLFILLAGGISIMRTTGWDSQSIRVEAQAIDMQIQLADLKYTNFVSTSGNAALKTSPTRPGSAAATKGTVEGNATSTVVAADPNADSTSTPALDVGEATTTPTSTAPIGVDAALDALSQ